MLPYSQQEMIILNWRGSAARCTSRCSSLVLLPQAQGPRTLRHSPRHFHAHTYRSPVAFINLLTFNLKLETWNLKLSQFALLDELRRIAANDGPRLDSLTVYTSQSTFQTPRVPPSRTIAPFLRKTAIRFSIVLERTFCNSAICAAVIDGFLSIKRQTSCC